MFSPLKHNWQIAFLWQELFDNKELTGSVFKVSVKLWIIKVEGAVSSALRAYSSISHTLDKIRVYPGIPCQSPAKLFSFLTLHPLSSHFCATKTWKWCFNHLTTPEGKWVNILAILLIQFNICLKGSLPQAYPCILNINRDSLMQFKPLTDATCRLLWSF